MTISKKRLLLCDGNSEMCYGRASLIFPLRAHMHTHHCKAQKRTGKAGKNRDNREVAMAPIFTDRLPPLPLTAMSTMRGARDVL